MVNSMIKDDCPCTKIDCERHGDCDACRENHYGKGNLPTCERDNTEKK